MAHDDTNAEGRPARSGPPKNDDTAEHSTSPVGPPSAGPLFDAQTAAPVATSALIERRDRRERITRSGAQAGRSGRILAHLRDVGPLTQMEAIRLGLGMRLGARVLELKQLGHAITTTMVTVECADGTSARVALYRLTGGAA